MFGNKRRRAASNPPINVPVVSASAATAASQAFLRSQSSTASLSAAAAAAALRSRPTTPTLVADVQTKRTLRRAGSNSSAGSSGSTTARGSTPSNLVRRGSSGSMSERTFRDPSPARSPSRSSAPVPSAPNAPPVPAIPQDLKGPHPPIPTKSHRRATSMDAPTMRVNSPPPNKGSGRGASLGPTQPAQNQRRAGQRSSGLSSVQELTGVERPASRGSVNFSLPTGLRPASPLGQQRLTSPSRQRLHMARIASPNNQNLVYDPNTRSFLPEAELLAIEQRTQDAANRQFRQKKKVPSAAGSHLSAGTAGGRPRGTAVDVMESATRKSAPAELPAPISMPPTPQAAVVAPVIPVQSPARKKKKRVVSTESDIDQIPYSSDTDSDVAWPAQGFNTRAGALLVKKPSIVREEREREEQEESTPDHLRVQNDRLAADTSPVSDRNVSPSPLPRSTAGRGHGRGQASSSTAYAQGRQHTRSASQPAPSITNPTFNLPGPILEAQNGGRGGRVQSVSPVRTTHFASNPENLSVKHQPPARSISPRKSALKHSSLSPRGLSPVSGESALTSVDHDIETSVAADELSVPKKRANRVSFEESHVVVGSAASPVATDSPVVQSPQSKRSWYSLGRGKKRDELSTEDDEIMKPRPALPSFGSVRDRKPSREMAEERALVKPTGPNDALEEKISLPAPPTVASPTTESLENPLGQSNDHIIGALLSQDAASKNEANISKSREPLPPQVTSVEGSGYHSDSDGSIYDVENTKTDLTIGRANSVKRGPDGADAETYQALASPVEALDTPQQQRSEEVGNPTVPKIAVLAATPTLESTVAKKAWPDMPGSWGSFTEEAGFSDPEEICEPVASTPAPIVTPTKSIAPIVVPTTVVPSPKPSPIAAPILEESEDSDSVYGDAAEELPDTDTDGDGFLSLDAVVESPIAKPPVVGMATAVPDSPKRQTDSRTVHRNELTRQNSAPDINDGWDKVQAYWTTLSADKRRQLESDARRKEEDSDTEVEAKPVQIPKKKKVVSLLPPEPEPQTQSRQVVIGSERNYMIPPGAKAVPNGYTPTKSSMRQPIAKPAGEPQMRKSMRGEGSMRGSLPSDPPEPRGSLQKKHRPLSLPPTSVQPDPVAVSQHIKALSIAGAKLAPATVKNGVAQQGPSLRRRGSADSDSSFKRARASSDVPTMRRSMRSSGEMDARAQSPMQSSRYSLRSLSPSGSTFRRPFGNSNVTPPVSTQNHMRTSMRSSFDTAPSLRNPESSRSGGFSLGSSKTSKPKPKAPRSSRFADSSDEEDGKSSNFRSRFDSSDEDEPAMKSGAMPKTMRSGPLRVPKRTELDDADSSDLPDSDDEKKTTSSKLNVFKRRGQNGSTSKDPSPQEVDPPPQNQPATTNNKQGLALASGSLRRSGSGRETIQSPTLASSGNLSGRPAQARRGSIMSILRRKKPDDSSKVRKSDAESAARRDTPLERSKSNLALVRNEKTQSPKLQKRTLSGNSSGGAWPLPAPSKITVGGEVGEEGRPNTADGAEISTTISGAINGSARPDLGRRFTATGLAGVDLDTLANVESVESGVGGVGGTGGTVAGKKKKKKFPKLRRMFGLDD